MDKENKNNIIEFPVNTLAGEAFCTTCANEWVAVAPARVDTLECPKCKTMTGKFRSSDYEGPLYWSCSCGSKKFHIMQEGLECCICETIFYPEDIWE